MSLLEIILIAIGLSMDAFAVSIAKGFSMRKVDYKAALTLAFAFGTFQAFMPLIGWLLAAGFADAMRAVDHWVAFVLLVVIGAKMLYDAIFGSDEEQGEREFSRLALGEVLLLALATSIDAFAVGVTFVALETNPFPAVIIIGLITFSFSFVGVAVGNRFGSRYEKTAGVVGGLILVAIGIKVLIEHLSIGI